MKTLLITLALILPLGILAQETKEYTVTSVQHWKLWQDTVWVLTDTEENTDYVYMASYESTSLFAKVFLSDQEYHVRCWIEKKTLNVDEFETTYAGKGELESNQRIVYVEFKTKYWDLTQLSEQEKDEGFVLGLAKPDP
jgi:hypothetical protein